MAKADNLVWIDLEMTGLDPVRDHVIEIATIVTDSALNVLAEGPVIAIHRSEAELAGMDEWNRTTHGASGLLERVRASSVSGGRRRGADPRVPGAARRRRGVADVRQQHLPGPSIPGA